MYFTNSGNAASKTHEKRKGDNREPTVFVVFWMGQKGGVNEGA